MFNSTFTDEFGGERNLFIILRDHTNTNLTCFSRIRRGFESQSLKTIEAITKIFTNLGSILTIRKNGKKRLIGQEIETRERLLLLFKIIIKSFFAFLNGLRPSNKNITTFNGTSFNDWGVNWNFSHHVLEFLINTFEDLSIFRKLHTDIFRKKENVIENLPILLNLKPFIDNNINTTKLITPVFDSIVEEFNIFTLGFHTHQIERVLI